MAKLIDSLRATSYDEIAAAIDADQRKHLERIEMANRVRHQRRLEGIDDSHVDPEGDARIERRLRLRDDEERNRRG